MVLFSVFNFVKYFRQFGVPKEICVAAKLYKQKIEVQVQDQQCFATYTNSIQQLFCACSI